MSEPLQGLQAPIHSEQPREKGYTQRRELIFNAVLSLLWWRLEKQMLWTDKLVSIVFKVWVYGEPILLGAINMYIIPRVI